MLIKVKPMEDKNTDLKLVKVGTVRKYMDAHYRDEISYTEAVNRINQQANKIMKAKLIDILEKHQKWRRDKNVPPKTEMQSPIEIGTAIDFAISELKKLRLADVVKSLPKDTDGCNINSVSNYFHCQREEEMESKCTNQCDHCKEYYKPLEQ